MVIKTAALNEEELAEYCRRKGLCAEQVQRWREAAVAGASSPDRLSVEERRERKKSRALEKDLKRKEKALAEAAALLLLQKKAKPSGGEVRTNSRPGRSSDGY
ncbi:hypothetical protein MO867_20750 [Microbulbifer sp. OS29]|uniref:AdoMet activation domain-containing protein n=1 Tax=Microbulbifer okhotskensis TaxID=2926617 RepID=A0A9X2ES39_9GAMM|nr:hypothetical protein [Microbulbifer okhotskensis]MCO1336760.1 hypothetical protein [Microbulbifer okhotskensis]